MPKIEKIDYTVDEEMRRLADKMQDVISTAVSQKIISDERKLREVLYENGYRKASEVAFEVVDDFQRRIRHIFLEMCCGNDYNTLNLLEIDSAIEALYDTFSAELKKKYTEGGNVKSRWIGSQDG